ncbi:hypothetical protein [Rhizobium leguminosarum]|uniref:hypothetical protein n=1 Tax=Rhizobium leguminosarum TaxID=384 RepID=UPI0015BA7D09|nr:hypothetical protein [Rhizobium leguminosarum]
MSRAHAAEKVDGDQGGQADCHCFTHVVAFQTLSIIGTVKAAPAMKVPLHTSHIRFFGA